MKKFSIKTAALAIAVTLGAVAYTPKPAEASGVVAYIAGGLIVGTVIGAIIHSHHARHKGRAHRGYVFVRGPAWYSYCRSKYRSFDPHSGTYQPYKGPRRLCR